MHAVSTSQIADILYYNDKVLLFYGNLSILLYLALKFLVLHYIYGVPGTSSCVW